MLKLKDKIILSPLFLISVFPFWIKYRISDALYILGYYIVGYRKKVVFQNLEKSFPEKDKKELKNIAKKFYRHLCDTFFESLSLLTLSDKNAKRRFQLIDTELIDDILKENKSFIVASSHYANWEWGCIFSLFYPEFIAMPVYKPLSNKMFDRFFLHLRTRLGATAVPMKQTLRAILNSQRQKQLFALYLLGDQRPGLEDLNYWTKFLNQDTPMITGMEKLAKKFNLAVVFMDIDKVKRGVYQTTFKLISDNPKDEAEYAITEKYVRMFEQMVQRRPELWLWSHKRWKFNKADYISASKSHND